MPRFRRLHQLDQYAAHVTRVQEDDRRSVRPDARLACAQDRHPLGAHFGDGGVDVGDLETDVVLAALGILARKPTMGLVSS